MKIYFNASLAGRLKYERQFKKIVQLIEELGHDVYADHVLKRDFKEVNRQSRQQHEADFQKARKKIQQSDAMIVEASYPSIGVGRTMSICLEMKKNVLVLYQTVPHGLLLGEEHLLIGDKNRLLTVKKYGIENAVKLREIITTFLKKVEKRTLKIRFNLMIDKAQKDYLNWISKRQTISKSDFIRQLIDKSILNNGQFRN